MCYNFRNFQKNICGISIKVCKKAKIYGDLKLLQAMFQWKEENKNGFKSFAINFIYSFIHSFIHFEYKFQCQIPPPFSW